MKSIDSFFQQQTIFQHSATKQAKVFTTERGELMEKILTRINKEREGTKWKPLTPVALSIKLKGVKTKDLYSIHKTCTNAKGYGWCFFGMMKRN